MNVLIWIILIVFAVAAVLALIKVVTGPSILDRAVACDVLLTEALCILGAEMVINQHTRSLPAMLIIAAVGVFGSIAVARFVARRDGAR
jgi:multicomponent Na+:H+ antiporter subunit F